MPKTETHNVNDMTRGGYRRQYADFVNDRRIAALSFEAEAWFWRIHAAADDFGNLTADAQLLYLATAGRRVGSISVEKVEALVAEIEQAGLIERYDVDGDSYLHVVDFEERQPAGKNGKRTQRVPKVSGCKQVNPSESGGIQVNPDFSRGMQGNPGEPGVLQNSALALSPVLPLISPPDPLSYSPSSSPLPNPFSLSPEKSGESEEKANASARFSTADVERIYDAYPRKKARDAAMKAIRGALKRINGRHPPPASAADWLLERVKRYAAERAGEDANFTPHPATWFNEGRYDDEPEKPSKRGGKRPPGHPDEYGNIRVDPDDVPELPTPPTLEEYHAEQERRRERARVAASRGEGSANGEGPQPSPAALAIAK